MERKVSHQLDQVLNLLKLNYRSNMPAFIKVCLHLLCLHASSLSRLLLMHPPGPCYSHYIHHSQFLQPRPDAHSASLANAVNTQAIIRFPPSTESRLSSSFSSLPCIQTPGKPGESSGCPVRGYVHVASNDNSHPASEKKAVPAGCCNQSMLRRTRIPAAYTRAYGYLHRLLHHCICRCCWVRREDKDEEQVDGVYCSLPGLICAARNSTLSGNELACGILRVGLQRDLIDWTQHMSSMSSANVVK